MDKESILHNFIYHAPDERKTWLHAEVRERALQFALWLESHIPDGRERSLALTKLEETMYHANAAIARNELDKFGYMV